MSYISRKARVIEGPSWGLAVTGIKGDHSCEVLSRRVRKTFTVSARSEMSTITIAVLSGVCWGGCLLHFVWCQPEGEAVLSWSVIFLVSPKPYLQVTTADSQLPGTRGGGRCRIYVVASVHHNSTESPWHFLNRE